MSPSQRTQKIRTGSPGALLLLGVAVFAFAWLLYANTLGNDFVWDDRTLILENTDLRTFDGESVERLFTTHYWEMTGKPGGLYRPISALSFYLDYRIHQNNPTGYHATNATLNALVCVLVFAVIQILFGNAILAFITALMFASLPLHTENVAWVAGRTDLIATLFMLLSLLAYAWWRIRGTRLGFVLSTIAFILAVLAKEFALVLPPLILVLEVGPFTRLERGEGGVHKGRLAVTFMAFFGLAAAFFAVRKVVLGSSVQSFEPFATGVADTVALSTSILAHYCYKLAFPFLLNAEWEAAIPENLLNPHSLAGVLIAALSVYVLRRWWRRGEVVLGITVLLVGITPVLNVFPITEVTAERFLYFPSMGFCLLAAFGFTVALTRSRTPVLVALVILLAAYGARTATRNLDWRDEATLFGKTAAAASDNARAHLNLGNAHYRADRHRQALAEYRKAVAIDPGDARVWSGMAGAHKALGQVDEAFGALERALAIEPTNAGFHNSLGVLLINRKDLEGAIASFQRALELQPDHARARFNLGLALFNHGDYAGAVRAFTELEDKDIDHVHAYYYLAAAEAMLGNAGRAADHAATFLRLYDRTDQFRARAQEMLSGKPPRSLK